MNWLLTALFLLFSCIQFILVGLAFTQLFGYKVDRGLSFIAGYLATFGLLMLPGVLSQILSLSWIVYFWISLIIIVLADGLIIWRLKESVVNPLPFSKYNILVFIKENWVIVLFTVLFSLWSLANQLSICNGGYDDFYYIGKIVNNVGSTAIGREEYFNGSILPAGTSISLERILNTYELSYGFFATLFHIEIAFFCRVSMTILNYLVTGITFCEFCGLFLKKQIRQYGLVFIFILLIPAGGLQGLINWLPKIYAYDLWQFQTAIFYGGSVVRDLSLPVFLLFSTPLFCQLEFKKILAVALLTVCFLSFSTIVVSTFIVFSISIIFIKIIYEAFANLADKGYVKFIMYILVALVFSFVVFTVSYGIEMGTPLSASYMDAMSQYIPFVQQWYTNDFLLRWSWLICLIMLVFTKTWRGRLVMLTVLSLTLLVKNATFYPVLMLSSVNVFFVAMRTVTSVQILLLLCTGIIPVLLLNKFKLPSLQVVLSAGSAAYILIMVLSFILNRSVFVTNPFLASGISPYGWSFGRALNVGSRQQAEVVTEIGDYFNSLPYGNYTLATASTVPQGDLSVAAENFMTGSNRIQIIYRNGIEQWDEGDISRMDAFLSNDEISGESVRDLISSGILDFILVPTAEKAQFLESMGYSDVLQLSNGNQLMARSEQ